MEAFEEEVKKSIAEEEARRLSPFTQLRDMIEKTPLQVSPPMMLSKADWDDIVKWTDETETKP